MTNSLSSEAAAERQRMLEPKEVIAALVAAQDAPTTLIFGCGHWQTCDPPQADDRINDLTGGVTRWWRVRVVCSTCRQLATGNAPDVFKEIVAQPPGDPFEAPASTEVRS